jgi:hypothetical protein
MAKKKASSAQAGAEEIARTARKALQALGLPTAVDKQAVVEEGVEHWEAFSTSPIVLPNRPLPGRWYLRMSWLVSGDPGGQEAQLIWSSMSLGGDGDLTENLTTDCLVRYDVDHRATAPTAGFSAAHLNVLQPGKLEDRMHYPAIGLDVPTWDIRAVLTFLTSPRFWDDLSDPWGAETRSGGEFVFVDEAAEEVAPAHGG